MRLNPSQSTLEEWVRKGLVPASVLSDKPPKIKKTGGESIVATKTDAFLELVEDTTGAAVFVVVPVKTRSPNQKEHWAATMRRVDAEHTATELALAAHNDKRASLAKGCTVTLRRLSVGELDGDNLAIAFKAIRDSVAAWLLGGTYGERDSDPRIEWVYEQARTYSTKVYGVTIAIRRRRK